jgi:hypothetical protein
MRTLSVVIVLFLCALWMCDQHSAADSKLAVDEAGIRLLLTGTSPLLELPLVNPMGKPVEAVLEIEIVLQNDYEVFKTEKKLTLAPGRATVSVPLKLGTDFKGDDLALFMRNRLRFRLGPATSSADVSGKLIEFEKRKPDAEGIIAFSEIETDAFQLRLVSNMEVVPGMRLPVRAKLASLKGDRPVAGVPCEFRMTFPGLSNPPTLTARVVSGPDGEAATFFNLPPSLGHSRPEIEVIARRGNYRRVAATDLEYRQYTPLLLFLDKSFYQPGQTVHVRLLAFDEFRRAFVGKKLQVEITGRDNDTAFKTTVTTSRFGIAVCDWPIPASVATGDYKISAEFEEEGHTNSGMQTTIRVSRYELPEFVVTATPDRGFYPPDQNAEVTIRADYLFGKPVGGGNVRIVRAADNYWDNEARQNIDIPEATVTGIADASGKFSTTFDLSPFRRKFSEYERFADVAYTAFVTDPTTGRTESRRFDIRISPDPIHVYILYASGFIGLPFKIPVRTFTADGAPLACDVTVAALPEKAIPEGETRRNIVRKVLEQGKRIEIRTNRFGLALIDSSLLFTEPDTSASFHLVAVARDAKGRGGLDVGGVGVSNEPMGLSVATDRQVYRPGWPMTIDVTGSTALPPNQTVLVAVTKNDRILLSRRIRLDGRRGRLVISNTANFGGVISVTAGCPFAQGVDANNQPIAGRAVYFQQPGGVFRVDTTPDRETYRPGAPVSVGLRAIGGIPTRSILGVSIVDRALLERVRTDSEEPWQYRERQADWYFLNNAFPTDIEGVTADVLERLDLSKPVPSDLDAAVTFLIGSRVGTFWSIAGDSDEGDPAKDFIEPIGKALMPTLVALEKMSAPPGAPLFPRDDATLRQKLAEVGIAFDEVRDPWGTPFKTRHDIEREKENLNFLSAGPDKRFGTNDDFIARTRSREYFRQLAFDIDVADSRYRARSGKYIRDLDTLKTVLRAEGIDFDALRDPWGRPYRVKFDVEELSFVYSFESENPSGERFTLHTVKTPYLGPELKAVRDAIETDYTETNVFPQDEATLRSVLKKKGISLDAIRDGWGRPLYPTFRLESVYSDLIVWKGNKTGEALTVTPVTRRLATIELRSLGPDGVARNFDDFKAFDCSQILLETNASGEKRNPRVMLPAEGKCGLFGLVRDSSGAVIAGALVQLLDKETGTRTMFQTNGDGRFDLRNLRPGNFLVLFSASGFVSTFIDGVILKDGEVVELNVELSAGGSTEVVAVSAGPPPETQKVKGGDSTKAATVGRRQTSTPRIRKYFPETLLWQPEVVTDARGRATVKFRMADSLTTWRMSVVATTTDGRIATTERDLKVFQPFFADVDPPPVLTKGDEISLPVVTRNYLNATQPATVTLSTAPWFAALDGTARTVEVKPNEAGTAVFPLRATAPIQDGTLAVTVRGADEGDAVEKPVTVHPDGAERFATTGRIVGADGAFDLDIPATALPDALRTELKFYPNLSAHVLEGIEGILERPHGCGEQTISSAYVNVLALRMFKQRGMLDSPVALRALENTREGIARLTTFQQWTGGFTYWGGVSEPDAALTAYALRFLKDAGEFAPVDESMVSSARKWLLKNQSEDGRWRFVHYWSGTVDDRRTILSTAYVAWTLADADDTDIRASVKKALGWMAGRTQGFDEPYVIALFALASNASGDTATARDAAKRLRGLAKTEGDTMYWALETNTPFYGWGLAGRIETTALVIAALRTVEGADPVADELVNRGVSFLLKKKDGYGVWYSTQATVAALKALETLVVSERDAARTARVFVDDQPAGTLAIPDEKTVTGPLTLDLSKLVGAGKHRVAIRREDNAGFASAQVVTRYFLPWSDVPKDDRTPLKLNVAFDRTELAVGEAVRCTVGVERVGHRGDGMLVAEVGLPPGVEVDRASLARALTRPGVWRADVMPDRVVVYLWSNAGGDEFEFSFVPRLAMRAKTAASTLYDYYNPEAATTLGPKMFVVGVQGL